ncbi:MAG: T9SS type A sorting domain-containing protein [Saprospiraceae bacterium]|nr:T9SS type A sorting domain-containing protein [Saprospiraceae bacterium]
MRFLLSYLLAGLCSAAFSQQIIYVNQAATGANTGASWADAYKSLQTALTTAAPGNQVWVAQGLYIPTSGTEREVSFNLPNAVKLYGGFNGTETLLDQRQPSIHKSILSGDIGISGVRTDNSFHVVTIYQGDEQTILDGFTITQGYGEDISVGFPHSYGGGVLVSSDLNWPVASPIIAQCVFERNRSGAGGGLACVANEFTHCLPVIRNCTFKSNQSQLYGGGLYTFGANNTGQPCNITDCHFEANKTSLGGGIYMEGITDTLRFRRCTFVKDTVIEGGGVFVRIGGQKTHFEVDSCNFIANHMNAGAGGGLEFMVPGDGWIDTVGVIVQNSRFFLNKSGIGGGIAIRAAFFLKQINCQIRNCFFDNNISQNGGGGILVEAGDGVNSDVLVDRCYFLGNKTLAASVAAGFYYRASFGTLRRNKNILTNCVFMHNDGAVAALGGDPGISHTRVANCSFYRNGDIPFVKYWGTDSNPDDLVQTMQILNSVLWEPQTEGVHRLFYNNDPVNFTVNDYLIEHSLIHLATCNYNGVDPCGEGMIYETWPNFINPEFGNTLEVWSCSPAQNRGSNLVADTFGLIQDYWGIERILGDTIDMGAYEIQDPCFSGTGVLISESLPIGIRLLQNPVIQGNTIEAELFAIKQEKLLVQLVETQGKLVWKSTVKSEASMPVVLSIPISNLGSGIYFLQVMDQNGRSKTEKVVVMK